MVCKNKLLNPILFIYSFFFIITIYYIMINLILYVYIFFIFFCGVFIFSVFFSSFQLILFSFILLMFQEKNEKFKFYIEQYLCTIVILFFSDYYEDTIPTDAPPSFRGQAVKYSYKVIIGTQRLDKSTKLLRVPFRVLVLYGAQINILF